MDFLAVAQGEQRMLDMLDAAQQEGLYVQGHVPVSDKRLLSAYAIGGPTTCHETREGEDAVSKLRLGLRIDARESSIAKDVEKIYSQVRRLRYIDRGYANLENKLRALGADIVRVPDPDSVGY